MNRNRPGEDGARPRPWCMMPRPALARRFVRNDADAGQLPTPHPLTTDPCTMWTPTVPRLKPLGAAALCLAIAACASGTNERFVPLAEAGSMLPHSSAECLASKIKPSDPFPASAIPETAMARRQSGWVAIRYDVIAGAAQNLVVVASSPAGLYDTAALQHAARYRDPGKATVRGCVMIIDVRF